MLNLPIKDMKDAVCDARDDEQDYYCW